MGYSNLQTTETKEKGWLVEISHFLVRKEMLEVPMGFSMGTVGLAFPWE